MKGVWSSLRPPIRVLAPMEDVTDHVFRDLIARLGAPDLYVTEFILADVVAGLSPDQLALRRHPHRAGRPGDGGAAGNTHGGPSPGGSPRPGDGGA
ncbi:MAG: tRNA-dihydrouridine synthase, partial [Alkalispirochaetaceae bacterium]